MISRLFQYSLVIFLTNVKSSTGSISQSISMILRHCLQYLLISVIGEHVLIGITKLIIYRGSRFRYTYYRPSRNEPGGRLGKFDDVDETGDSIHESISGLDHEAWDILSEALKDPKQTHESFTKYLSETGNTICGRHAFGILLGALHHANRDYTSGSVKWTHYTQSSKALLPTDSSVSYSAGYMTM